MAFSLFTSVSSSSMFSRICGVMLSAISGASYTVSRAGVAVVDSNASPDTRSMRPGLRPNRYADVVVRPVALMDAHFLALAFGKINQLGRNRQPRRLLQQRPQLAAQRAARDVRQSKGILDHRIIGAANFERSFPGADVQPGLAGDVSLEDQFSDQLQFGLRCVRTHVNR